MNGIGGMQNANISPQFLLDWFLKSLLPTITKDVAATCPTNEVEAIQKAQHFYLIYAQSRYFYMILIDAPRHRPLDEPTPKVYHSIDRLIGNMATVPPPVYLALPYVPPHLWTNSEGQPPSTFGQLLSPTISPSHTQVPSFPTYEPSTSCPVGSSYNIPPKIPYHPFPNQQGSNATIMPHNGINFVQPTPAQKTHDF